MADPCISMEEINTIKNQVNELNHRQSLIETNMRYFIDDLKYVRSKIDEFLQQRKKDEIELRKREQFFIDSVMTINEIVEKLKKDGNNKTA